MEDEELKLALAMSLSEQSMPARSASPEVINLADDEALARRLQDEEAMMEADAQLARELRLSEPIQEPLALSRSTHQRGGIQRDMFHDHFADVQPSRSASSSPALPVDMIDDDHDVDMTPVPAFIDNATAQAVTQFTSFMVDGEVTDLTSGGPPEGQQMPTEIKRSDSIRSIARGNKRHQKHRTQQSSSSSSSSSRQTRQQQRELQALRRAQEEQHIYSQFQDDYYGGGGGRRGGRRGSGRGRSRGYRHQHRYGQMEVDIDNMSYEQLLEWEEKQGKVKSDAAPISAISQLPSHFFETDGKTKKKNEEEQSCSICQEPFEQLDEITTLPCFHHFHKDEIEHWLKIKNSCPTCQTKIDGFEGI